MCEPSPSRRSIGFTLIEVLVGISVVLIVFGLVLPQLAGARERARAIKSAANLRSIGQVLVRYSDVHRERFPAGEVGRLFPITGGGRVSASLGNYFRFGRNWPILVRDVAPWDQFLEIWFSPGRRVPSMGEPSLDLFSYPLSHSVMARPALWRVGAAVDDGLLEPTRQSDTAHPSSKVLSWDSDMAYLLRPRRLDGLKLLANPTPMLFADGHAREEDPASAAEPILNVMNPDPAEHDMPLHNTPLGVLGRDY